MVRSQDTVRRHERAGGILRASGRKSQRKKNRNGRRPFLFHGIERIRGSGAEASVKIPDALCRPNCAALPGPHRPPPVCAYFSALQVSLPLEVL